MGKSMTIGKSALLMTLGVVGVFAAFTLYIVYAEYARFAEASVEILFWLIIMALCVVIGIGFFWGSFVSRVTSEIVTISEFLKRLGMSAFAGRDLRGDLGRTDLR